MDEQALPTTDFFKSRFQKNPCGVLFPEKPSQRVTVQVPLKQANWLIKLAPVGRMSALGETNPGLDIVILFHILQYNLSIGTGSIGVLAVVVVIGVAGWYIGSNNDRFLTCDDFKVAGSDQPENCAKV